MISLVLSFIVTLSAHASEGMGSMRIEQNLRLQKLDFDSSRLLQQFAAQGTDRTQVMVIGVLRVKGRHDVQSATRLLGPQMQVRAVLPNTETTIVTFAGTLAAVEFAAQLDVVSAVQGLKLMKQ